MGGDGSSIPIANNSANSKLGRDFIKEGKIGIKQISKQRVSFRRKSMTMRDTYQILNM